MPLSACIRICIFQDDVAKRIVSTHAPVQDREGLAKILGLLGPSQLAAAPGSTLAGACRVGAVRSAYRVRQRFAWAPPTEGLHKTGTRGVTFALCIFLWASVTPRVLASLPSPDELKGAAEVPNWVRRLLYPLPAAPLNSLRPRACGQEKAGAFGPGRAALPVLPESKHHPPHATNASGSAIPCEGW